jgi:hypothetical protein
VLVQLDCVHGSCELVTCNAPIPDPDPTPYRAMWRFGDADLVARALAAAARLVGPGGLVVVHAAEDALAPALAGLPGDRSICTYTPDGVRGFAVAWWRPDGSSRLRATRRALTPEQPHVTAADRGT